MRRVRKLVALLLSLAMVLAMSGMAMAAATLNGGEVGGSSTFATDNPQTQSKSINIKKELTAYNANETSIKAPTITYTYTVTAGDAGVKITDAASDHANTTAVTVETKAGIIPNVRVTGSSDGVTNTSGVTAGATATSVSDTISWTTGCTLTASGSGAENYQNLNIDFSNVVFGAAGVYRYVITEAIPDYTASGVTATTNTTNPHVRYLDVYVRPNPSTFTNGNIAADWDIYGYVCLLENEEITDAGDTSNTGAVKTNGFVAGTNDGTAYLADSYYTYNVTISKTVTNDNYAKATHKFPFTVTFANNDITANILLITSETGTVEDFTHDAGAPTWTGVAKLLSEGSIKYIGIPCGTSVEVYETNDVTGVTYQVTTVIDGATPGTVDAAVVNGDTSTVASITTTAGVNDTVNHTIAIDNNLQTISPTGLMFRYGPYVLILICGVVLLFLGVKFMRRNKEED